MLAARRPLARAKGRSPKERHLMSTAAMSLGL
jgi:hypothetical protein